MNGINLNILECKKLRKQNKRRKHRCINLNILECKRIYKKSQLHVWTSINLNILECKIFSGAHAAFVITEY